MAGNLFQADLKFFKQALFTDTLRGAHSTGMLAVDKKNACTYLKTTDAGPDFVKLKAYAPSITDKILAGHNRYATQGAHTKENAHPFHHGNVVLMHNGTLYSRRGLSTQQWFTVDSEHIAYTIGNCRSDAEIIDVLEKLDGAFALVWYNIETDVLYVARNEERELSMARTQDTVYWASEGKMLEWLLDRNSIKASDAVLIPTGKLYKFDLSSGNKVTDKVVEELDFEPAEVYPATWYSGYRSRRGGGHSTNTQYTAPTMREWGYTKGDFVEFKATRFVKYTGATEYGTLYGIDPDTDRPVVVYSVSSEDLTFTNGEVDKDINYAASLTSMSRPTFAGVSQAYHLTLDSKDMFSWDENYVTDDDGEEEDSGNVTWLVGGKKLTEQDVKELKRIGCGCCGHPIDEAHFDTVVWDDDGHAYHNQGCLNEAISLMRSCHIH